MQRALAITYWVVIFLLPVVPGTALDAARPANRNLDNCGYAQQSETNHPGPRARLVDKFGALGSDDEKARLDNFAIELQQDPRNTGYIIVYGQKGKSSSEAKKRADRAKKYLLYYRNMDHDRIISIDYCFRKRLEFELWIVPAGASPPPSCAATKAKSPKTP